VDNPVEVHNVFIPDEHLKDVEIIAADSIKTKDDTAQVESCNIRLKILSNPDISDQPFKIYIH
jgi:DNA-binding protein